MCVCVCANGRACGWGSRAFALLMGFVLGLFLRLENPFVLQTIAGVVSAGLVEMSQPHVRVVDGICYCFCLRLRLENQFVLQTVAGVVSAGLVEMRPAIV